MHINQFWLRTFGLLGIVGGLVLFVGDMLFYYDGNSTNLILNMAHTSDFNIKASGITALVGAWLYMLGLVHVYYAFKPSTAIIKYVITASFGAILISYGVIHGAYVAIAATAKLALEHNLDLELATTLASSANQGLRLIVYPVFALLSIMFITQVLKKKTYYPRWIILFFPLLPFLLQGMVSKLLSGNLWVIINGGYLNLLLVLFFSASTIALWNKQPSKSKKVTSS